MPKLVNAHKIKATIVPAPIKGNKVRMALAQRAKNILKTKAPNTHQAGLPKGPKNSTKVDIIVLSTLLSKRTQL
jgi:hypothetical protein